MIGSSRQSYYIGPDEPALRERISSIKDRWEEDSSAAESRARLVAMLASGGATTPTANHGRVIEALEQAGVFLAGGVLIGSHAFAIMANLLGVKWPAVPFRQGILVNIPSPARFALHKLVVSQRRPPAFATKARKDITQAEAVLRVLLQDRPGDLPPALDAATLMPPKFSQQLTAGLQQLSPELRQALTD